MTWLDRDAQRQDLYQRLFVAERRRDEFVLPDDPADHDYARQLELVRAVREAQAQVDEFEAEPPPPGDADAPIRQPGEDREEPAPIRHGGSSPVVSISAAIDPAKALFSRRFRGEEKPMPLPWPGVSKALGGGLWPGAHVVTGTTAAGKTAFAIQVSISASLAGHPTLYIGLELDTSQIIARLASMALGEQDGRVTSHWSDIYLGRKDPAQLDEVLEQLRHLPIYVEEAPPGGWSAKSMRSRVEEMKLKHPGAPAPLVVLDFLQLVGPTDPGGRREELRERIGAAAYAGREVARRCGAVVLMISSISRAGASELIRLGSEEKLGEGDPADLVGLGKESGDIEFSADSVLVLAREPRSDDAPKDAPVNVWLAVAKQRAGVPSWRALAFNGSWLEEAQNQPRAEDRARTRREAREAAIQARRTHEAEAKIARITAVLQRSPRPMSVETLLLKVGGAKAGFRALLSEMESRGLAHLEMKGAKPLGWALGSEPTGIRTHPDSSGLIRDESAPMQAGGIRTDSSLIGEESGSRPASPAGPKMTPAERQALLDLDTAHDPHLEALAAQAAMEPDPVAEAIRRQVLAESHQPEEKPDAEA